MALFIPHRCPKCFESVTLIQPQYKGGAFKELARGAPKEGSPPVTNPRRGPSGVPVYSMRMK